MNGILNLFAHFMCYLSIIYILIIILRECKFESISVMKSIESNDECPICLESGCNVELPCTHKFHNKCIIKWFEEARTCPICRVQV